MQNSLLMCEFVGLQGKEYVRKDRIPWRRVSWDFAYCSESGRIRWSSWNEGEWRLCPENVCLCGPQEERSDLFPGFLGNDPEIHQRFAFLDFLWKWKRKENWRENTLSDGCAQIFEIFRGKKKAGFFARYILERDEQKKLGPPALGIEPRSLDFRSRL